MLWQQITKYLSFGSLRVSGCVCRSQCRIVDGFRLLPREIFGLMWMSIISHFYLICTFGNWNIADADQRPFRIIAINVCRHKLMPSIYRRACTGVGVDLEIREICLCRRFFSPSSSSRHTLLCNLRHAFRHWIAISQLKWLNAWHCVWK